MKYTHIIFDMDGTLVDTSVYTIPACGKASEEQALPVPCDEAIKESIGYCSEEYYRRILPGFPQETLDGYAMRVHDLQKVGIRTLGQGILFAGVREMLQALKDGEARLYIASTGELNYVQLALESAGIMELFSGIFAGEPSKEAMAARIKAISPESPWAFVGDRFIDSNAARAARMPSVFAGWGFTLAEEGELFTYVAHTTRELLQLLGYAGEGPQL